MCRSIALFTDSERGLLRRPPASSDHGS